MIQEYKVRSGGSDWNDLNLRFHGFLSDDYNGSFVTGIDYNTGISNQYQFAKIYHWTTIGKKIYALNYAMLNKTGTKTLHGKSLKAKGVSVKSIDQRLQTHDFEKLSTQTNKKLWERHDKLERGEEVDYSEDKDTQIATRSKTCFDKTGYKVTNNNNVGLVCENFRYRTINKTFFSSRWRVRITFPNGEKSIEYTVPEGWVPKDQTGFEIINRLALHTEEELLRMQKAEEVLLDSSLSYSVDQPASPAADQQVVTMELDSGSGSGSDSEEEVVDLTKNQNQSKVADNVEQLTSSSTSEPPSQPTQTQTQINEESRVLSTYSRKRKRRLLVDSDDSDESESESGGGGQSSTSASVSKKPQKSRKPKRARRTRRSRFIDDECGED
jgi:hypothetical protein